MHRFLLFVLSMFCVHGLFAQEIDSIPFDKPFRLTMGPKVGVGVSMGSHSNFHDMDFSPGLAYQFGAVFNAHFGRRFDLSDGGTGFLGLQVEANYSKRIVKLNSSPLSERCLEVPVLVQCYLSPTMALEAGATMVHLFGCSPAILDYQGAHFNTGGIKGNDVMLSVGACYKSSFGLMLDVRYNLGCSNLAGNFDTKISTAMASIVYLFTIVK